MFDRGTFLATNKASSSGMVVCSTSALLMVCAALRGR